MSILEGTVALVTGASSGIGHATARTLAADGAAVALVARRGDRLAALAQQITDAGGRALAVEADITDRSQARDAVARTVAELGRLDILVNNAGVMLLGPIEDAPIDEWDRMIDLNLTALLSMTEAALPHLLAAAESEPRRVADLINISSTAGRQVKRGSGVYNLTKHGVGAFSESFRQEFSRRHLRVGVVEPGAVDTELRDHLRPEIRDLQAQRLSTMEPLQAEDIADAIRYIVTRPRHQTVNEILLRPTEQDD
ncbi:SDR family NAD(P)-dependent oxidoreductase [Microbacterium sp. SORGH_AS_0888]|uniref:SDR family NAD(P)-dependent oxidoreductase n=1 Tax=Microbacterium sp. SORGH_AS_0888 TaxID=3041791 RepID=UPI00277D823C|nr:SDR family NAD(P)-dependent oxidoreductase [Microbacterium sp. SORGH_AS_0888]MDQ1129953.1 NADP-dependent 3-hydroxy acid dehydrogenase YdfG [Microbacterium sp. SORGH_AS_0888]